MASVTELLLAPIFTFLLVLAAVTSFKLLNGRIVTRGLITDPSGKVSALRVQMLLSTLSAAGVYGVALSRAEASSLPAPDAKLLMLVGGSNGLVVGAQALRRLVGFLGSASPNQKGKS